MGHTEQGDDHDDADHLEADHHGEGSENGQQILDEGDGQALGTGKVGVARDGNPNATVKKIGDEHHDGEQRQRQEPAGGDAKDVAEEIGGKVGHETGGEPGEEDAERHAKGPKHGDGAVFPHTAVALQPLDAETGSHGKEGGTPERGETEPSTQPHSTEGSMCHPTAGNDGTTGDHERTDDGAKHRHQQTAQQGITKKRKKKNHNRRIWQRRCSSVFQVYTGDAL